ncbi:Pleckstrin y domain-containing A member 8 [Sparganum proliferum]
MEGLLYKWTNYINGWQPRYFSLRDGVLSYYNSEVEVGLGCKGALKVAACEVIVSPSDSCRLDILDPGAQRFYLRARTPLERQKWIIALGSCKAGCSSPDNPVTPEIRAKLRA